VNERAGRDDGATVALGSAVGPDPVVPAQVRADSAAESRDATGAGGVLCGRYRLRTRVGSDRAAGTEFWCAQDTVLQRDVALTLVRPAPGADLAKARSAAGEMITRALRSGSFEHPGTARLLDVLAPGAAALPADVLAGAVSEWVPGRSLAETVADGVISPSRVARALQPLAGAAEAAHRHGFVLGCDHPERIRVAPDGRAQLCFALPRPDVLPSDDVRGLGAVLFALLTSRWPLSPADAARAGLATARRGPDGAPAPPSAMRPGIPVELDALAVGTLATGDIPGRVHTAAAVRRLVDEVVAEEERVELLPPARTGAPPEPGDVWQDEVDDRPDPQRRRKLLVGMGAMAVAALVAVGYVGWQVGAVFTDPDEPTIVVQPQLAPAGEAPPGGGAPAVPAAAAAPVAVATVDVVDFVGDSDNAGQVARVIDGDPGSTWRTFAYRQQFPALKPGVGIMVSFASAVQLSGVTIDSPSPGTRVELRSAPAADAALDETVLIGGSTLAEGGTTVPLTDSQPVEHVLLWITELGGGGGEYRSEIGEVEFRRVVD